MAENMIGAGDNNPHFPDNGDNTLYNSDGSLKPEVQELLFTDPRSAIAQEDISQGGLLGIGQYPEYEDAAQIELAKEDPSYLNSLRAGNQSALDQAATAILGGIAKGTLTAVEDLSYLTLGLGNTVNSVLGNETAKHNALSKWASENKKAIDAKYPIFREDPSDVLDFSDPGFYFSTLSSFLDSAVGMGVAGGVIGSATKALKLANLGKTATNVGQKILGGTAMNLAEGKLIAVEAFDKGTNEDKLLIDRKIDQEALQIREGLDARLQRYVNGEGVELKTIPSGVEGQTREVAVIAGTNITPEEWYDTEVQKAQLLLEDKRKALIKESLKRRGEQSNSIQQLNLPLAVMDMMHMRGILNAQDAYRREAMKGLKDQMLQTLKPREFVRQGFGEGVEEVVQEVTESETGFQAKLDQGLVKDNDTVDRFVEHLTSDESILSFGLGFLGGPFQTVATTMVSGLGDYITGSTKDRIKYNQDVEQKQQYVKELFDKYMQTDFVNQAENNARQREAMANQDEVKVSQLQKESFSDLFYKSAQAQQLNTLEENLQDIQKLSKEDSKDLNDDYKEQAAELQAMIPMLEEKYKKADKLATEKGVVNPALRKMYYDLSTREEVAKNEKNKLTQQYEQQYGEAIQNANDTQLYQDKQIDALQQDLLRSQDKVESYQKQLDSLNKKLGKKTSRLNRLENVPRNNELDRLLSNITNQNIEREIKEIEAKIKGITSEIENKKREAEIQGSRLGFLMDKVKADPNYQEAKESLDKIAELESAENLYKSTYNELRKPANKQRFTEGQAKLFETLANEIYKDIEEQNKNVAQKEAEEKAKNPEHKPDVAETVVSDNEYDEFKKTQQVSPTSQEGIADKVVIEQPLTPREQDIYDTLKPEIDKRVEEKRTETDVKRSNTFADNLDTFNTDIKENTSDDTTSENLIDSVIKAGLADNPKQAAYDTLPELRDKIEADKVVPPEEISKEDYIDKIDAAIKTAQEKYKPTAEDVTESQFNRSDVNRDPNWEAEQTKVEEEVFSEEDADEPPQRKDGEFAPTLRNVHSLAFSSNLEGQSQRLKNLVKFLEDPNKNAANYSVQFTVETNLTNLRPKEKVALDLFNRYKDRPNSIKAADLERLNNNLPIRANIMDDRNMPVEVDGEQLYGHIHTSEYQGWDFSDPVIREAVEYFLEETRPQIVENLIRDRFTWSPIIHQRGGYANQQYTYEYRGNNYKMDTQDAADSILFEQRKEEVSNVNPVKNSIKEAVGDDLVIIGIGTKEKNLAVKEGDEVTTVEYKKKPTQDRLYYKIRAANGSDRWFAAYRRGLTSNELELAEQARQGNLTVEDLRNTYSNEIDLVEQAMSKSPTLVDIANFYSTKENGKFLVQPSMLGNRDYIDAITLGDNPLLFTTAAPLKTAGREDINSVFIQPTTVISNEVIVGTKPTQVASSDIDVLTDVKNAIEFANRHIQDKTVVGALSSILSLPSREDVTAFTTAMNHLANIPFEANNGYAEYFNKVYELLTNGDKPSKETAYQYYIYSEFLKPNEQGVRGKDKDFKAVSGKTKELFRTINLIQTGIFENRDIAESFINITEGLPFEENPVSNEAYTDKQVNKVVREDVAEEVKTKARRSDIPVDNTRPEGTKDSIRETPKAKAKKAQVVDSPVATLFKGVEDVDFTQLPQAHKVMGKHVKKINPERLKISVKEAVEQAFSKAIDDVRGRKRGKKEEIAQILIKGKRLFSNSVKPFQAEFIAEYNPALAELYTGQEVPVIKTKQSEKPLEKPKAPEPKLDPKAKPDKIITATKSVTEDIPEVEREYPENQPKTVKDTAVPMKKKGAPIETTDVIEDTTKTPLEISEEVTDWIGETFKNIRENIAYKVPTISLARKDEDYKLPIKFMLELNPRTIEDWTRIKSTYAFITSLKPQIASRVNETAFLDAFREMELVAETIFKDIPQNSSKFHTVTNELLSSIGKYYILTESDSEALKQANNWLLSYVGRDNLIDLDPSMIDKVIVTRDQFFVSDAGKASLKEIPLKGFIPKIKGRGYSIRRENAQNLITGYTESGKPVFQEYINLKGVGVHKLSNVAVDPGSTVEVNRKNEAPMYVADYTSIENTPRYSFQDLINSDQEMTTSYNPDLADVRTIIVGERKQALDNYEYQSGYLQPPTLMDFPADLTLPVKYNSGTKNVDFRINSGQLQVRRKDASSPSWKAPNQNHINAYVNYLNNEYKKVCK